MLAQAIPNPVYEVQGEVVHKQLTLPANLYAELAQRFLPEGAALALSFDPNAASGDESKRLRTSVDIQTRDSLVVSIFSTLDAEMQQVVTQWGEGKFPYKSREQFLFYGVGAYSGLHTDDQHKAPEKQGKTKYVMHLLNQLAAILYVVSPDLEGGAIEFPKQQLSIIPKSGTMLVYPSNYKFPHQVTPVVIGGRFAFVRHYYFYDTPAA
jgi:predicted 2-oxoglutarate/Fe(II)-dependent dioxygenase YbiX